MFHEASHKWIQEIDKAGTRVDFRSILRRQQGRHGAVLVTQSKKSRAALNRFTQNIGSIIHA